MAETTKILVIRFSAMGDVAMVQPVLKEFTTAYPNTELLIVSRDLFRPFFEGMNSLSFHGIDPKGKHKGLFGLYRLFKELKAQNVTAVADLHNNLRSRILTTFFSLAGIRSATVDKGRQEKKMLTRKINKQLIPLALTVQRYADVFIKLGYPFNLKNTLQNPRPEALEPGILSPELADLLTAKQSAVKQTTSPSKWIGISPFAQHLQKVYPLHKLEEVLLALAGHGHQLFIFGGSAEEEKIAATWSGKHQNITTLVKKMKMADELRFISNLDLMLSMDSSGMHLASLKNIPVVSVWGATHPYAGFLGYGQSIADAVQTDLYCRPCSVYGNIPCYRGDFACMNNLPPQTVVDKVLHKLKHYKN
ncbi:MAG TPA: glycosyltransferase family 9 protein [Pedobacter sp.]|uniref:glycosyltransferase family 9 protein n=1 Tax=Pedobacter sp. TaxID=1411316 RepID=UPI002CCA962A|nr:glycosyltransferase family 9 protein [Pedobacter sp.]HMI02332.1 glycosyltransferase family 9 protein [Pedobacter sp.]